MSTRRRGSRTGGCSTRRRWWSGASPTQATAGPWGQYRLWDVYSARQIAGEQFLIPANTPRRLAHIIADAVYERLTGEKGYFDSRIVFVDETGPKDKRVKRLAIMDQDGANLRLLTQGRELVLTPRFHPLSQQITYTAYRDGEPRVVLRDIMSGQEQVLGNFPNMSFAPRFSPQGDRVVMSLQEGANSNIFEMDVRSRRLRASPNRSPSIPRHAIRRMDGASCSNPTARAGSSSTS